MDDLISKRDAIDAECEVCQIAPKRERGHNCTYYAHGCKEIECIRALPSVQPEQTRIISEMKAIPSDDDRVSLSETVTATYYDEEHEEWSRKIVTVRDVLDSVCDEYTVFPSAQPEIIRCKDCKYWKELFPVCNRINKFGYGVNDFCSKAERRRG